MKHLSFFFLFTFLLSSVNFAHADFFEDQIIGVTTEIALLEEIKLTPVSFYNERTINQHSNTRYFIEGVKAEAIQRFENNTISLYRRYDIITHLESFTYDMNGYFLHQKRYEQTRNMLYKETALSYLEDSRGSYSRLKIALKNSAY